MTSIDTTIVNVALPSIATALRFSAASLAWVVNAYVLTFGGFLLLCGRLADIYGNRRVRILGTGAAEHCVRLATGLHDLPDIVTPVVGTSLAREDLRLGRP